MFLKFQIPRLSKRLCSYRSLSSLTPSDRYYTKEHEWVMKSLEQTNVYLVGITDSAQKSLGDVVFVEFLHTSPDAFIEPNGILKYLILEVLAVVESVKGASDVFSPIGGKISSINRLLLEKPNTINRSPYLEGYLLIVNV